MAGEGFQIGFQAGNALAKGLADWKAIQLDKQQRKEFDGAMALASQRRAAAREAINPQDEQLLQEYEARTKRNPGSQIVARSTGEVAQDGSPETEQVIQTPEGDIPVGQVLQLRSRKRQNETAVMMCDLDVVMELQSRYPDNRYIKQWAASTYANVMAKQQIASKQLQAQRLQLDTINMQRAREEDADRLQLDREKLDEQRRQFDAGPEREREAKTLDTDEGIRRDAARIKAQKGADLEVEGVRAQNKPERAPTEFDKKIRQMAPRAKQALDTIEQLEQAAPDEVYDRTGLKAGLESIAPNAARTGKRQQYEQAVTQLVNSLLRAESGATITESEISKAREQYIPRLGESPEVVEQKRQARRIAVEELYRVGGLEPTAGAAQGGEVQERTLKDGSKVRVRRRADG